MLRLGFLGTSGHGDEGHLESINHLAGHELLTDSFVKIMQ